MTRTRLAFLLPMVLSSVALAGTPVGHAITYQGKLQDAGQPANGLFDFTFTLSDALDGGTAVAAPILLEDIPVENGIFSVQLDFGAGVFQGDARFLDIGVREGSSVGAFDALVPRQPLTAAPYALHALDGAFDASAIVSGNIAPARLPASGIWVLSNPLWVGRPDAQVGFGTSGGPVDALLDASAWGDTKFRLQIDGGTVFKGIYDGGMPGFALEEGAGTRMMWNPRRAAFRAGSINGTQWDDANIGNFSAAFGENVRASGEGSFAAGRNAQALNMSATAVGENVVASGAASVAMGYGAHTNARQGSFVFADRSTVDELRAGVNHSANWRTSGGFRIFTSSNLSSGVTVQSGASVSNWGQSNAVISTSTGAYLSTGGIWTNVSDVNRKHGFAPVDGEDVLARLRALPITRWSYRVEPADVRHIGPTAQDFHAAFGLGRDEKAIGSVDADGVALAAAKALEQRTSDQLELIEALQAENADLKRRLERLEALIEAR